MCPFRSLCSKLTNHSGLVLIFDAKKPPLYFLALCSFLTALKTACNQKKKIIFSKIDFKEYSSPGMELREKLTLPSNCFGMHFSTVIS